MDTKKKELVGNYANAGRQWRPMGTRLSGLNGPRLSGSGGPRAYPYGIYGTWGATRVSCERRTDQ